MIFIVCYGLLNLIVAAILDASVQAREDDHKNAAKMHRRLQREAFDTFREMCGKMDSNDDGGISAGEFLNELHVNKDLQSMLCSMGVDEHKVEGLFKLMGHTGGSNLNYEDFIEQFSNMRTHVVKTSLFYVLKYVESIH